MPSNAYSPRRFTPRTFSTGSTPPTAEKKPREPLKITGDVNAWVIIQHIDDPNTGWTKTTRAMPAAGGLILNTCARKKGMAVCSEALVFVPGAQLVTVGKISSVK
jgi:hypothetical protein